MSKKKKLMKKLEKRILEIRDQAILDEGITVLNTAYGVEHDNVCLQWFDKNWDSHSIYFWDDGEGWYNVVHKGETVEHKEWKSQEEFELYWATRHYLTLEEVVEMCEGGVIFTDGDFGPEVVIDRIMTHEQIKKSLGLLDDDTDNIEYHYD
jgi:hypothetical protein